MTMTPVMPLSKLPASSRPPAPEGQRRLRIIYQNDSHLAWDKLASSVTAFDWFSKQGKAEGKDVLRLHGGDYMTGSSERNFSLALQIANRMQLHGMALGNHELDMGIPTFVQQLQRHANFPTIVNNLAIQPLQQGHIWLKGLLDSGKLRTSPQLIQKSSGNQYAILGITQPAERFKVRPENLAMGVAPLPFEDTIQRTQAQVDALKKQGIQNIILLSHMGYDVDCRLAKRLEGVDVIVGGDTHDVVHGATPGVNRVKSPSGHDVLVLQAGANAEYVGVADLILDEQGRIKDVDNRLYASQQFAPDPSVASAIDATLPANRFIATLTAPFPRGKSYLAPQPFAEFVADSVRQEAGADIALIRRPEVRSSLPAGPLMSRELEKALPYDSEIMVVQLTGQRLKDVLFANLKRATKFSYGVVHPSGLSFKLNPNTRELTDLKTWHAGAKSWEPLSPNKTYTVAVSDYILKNPSIFPGLIPSQSLQNQGRHNVRRLPLTLRECTARELQRRAGAQRIFTPPESDNRVTISPAFEKAQRKSQML